MNKIPAALVGSLSESSKEVKRALKFQSRAKSLSELKCYLERELADQKLAVPNTETKCNE